MTATSTAVPGVWAPRRRRPSRRPHRCRPALGLGSEGVVSSASTVVGRAAKPRTLTEWTRSIPARSTSYPLTPRQHLGQHDARLHAGQRGPHAEMAPAAEADQVLRAAVEVVGVGVGEDGLVPVGRPEEEEDAPTRLDVDALGRAPAGSSPGPASASRCRSAASPPPSPAPGPDPPAAWPAGPGCASPSTRRCRAAWSSSRSRPPRVGRGTR